MRGMRFAGWPRVTGLIAGIVIGAPQVARAQAALINFDDVSAGTRLDEAYLPRGVLFGCLKDTSTACNGSVQTAVAPNYHGGPAASGAHVITISSASTLASPAFNESAGWVKVHFLSPVKTVSIYAKPYKPGAGTSWNKPYLQAFNASNQWLATAAYTGGNSGGWQKLTIERPITEIQYVVFSAYANLDSVAVYGLFDDLSYEPVPPPQWKSVVAGNGLSVGLKTDGSLWVWGKNNHGQTTATGSYIDHPQKVGGNDWRMIAAGSEHVAAIRNDGTMWAWGWNGAGQLGDGSTIDRSAPVRVGSDSDWIAVAAGADHTLGIRRDAPDLFVRNSLWSWGGNGLGQLCDNTTSNHSTPTAVSLFQAAAIGGGDSYSLVIQKDTVGHPPQVQRWMLGCGYNGFGQLGNGRTDNSKTPAYAAFGVDAIAVGSGHAAGHAAGQLWTWGLNSHGQVGDGTTGDRSTPFQVWISGTGWRQVAAGGQHTVAIAANGTLWAWGWNAGGQLGDGTTTDRLVPVQIGTDTDWIAVAAGFDHTLAIKANGTLWSWGKNTNGQLGDRTTTTRSVPTRAGQLMVTPTTAPHVTLTPAAPQAVDYMNTVAFRVVTPLGYVASIKGCGGTLQGQTYVTAPVAADCTVTPSATCALRRCDPGYVFDAGLCACVRACPPRPCPPMYVWSSVTCTCKRRGPDPAPGPQRR